ncbi:MAG: bis(5'-nucleosyl)-tetraphosphatase (symmetrical) YqeK [Lachnospiraceae bacterium]|nr:bis(5'-nucleosyl)-tetraphosphatase (symmetrical) YqeK [Lachnospiraceae bacterium]
MNTKVLEIRKSLKKKLDPFRFEHTMGVAYTCQALAMRYEYDLHKAELAGLLHDCAKRFDNETMLSKCQKREIPMSDGELRDPSLLHAKLGAWYAKEKYGVEDQDILTAIECHTTGKKDMTLLDKILYVADYIEPGRYKASELPEMRKLAFIDLDLACLSIMESILKYLESTNCPIDTTTIDACEDMRRVVAEKQAAVQAVITVDQDTVSPTKEVNNDESVKRNGKNRRIRSGRQKRRRH